jgi:threonyl-tRNA synthetase
LCYGPPIENGFYYDMFIDDKQVSLLLWYFESADSGGKKKTIIVK